MFSFFKRSDKGPDVASHRSSGQARGKSVNARGLDLLSPIPLPEVTEGNQDSDWAMWEDSVLEQDSQSASQFADTCPSQLDEAAAIDVNAESDPFAQVSRHAP